MQSSFGILIFCSKKIKKKPTTLALAFFLNPLSEVSAYLCDPAELAFVCGTVAGARQWTLLNRTSTVQRNKRGSAQIKWIMGVIVQLMGVSWSLLTGCQYLASLRLKTNKHLSLVNQSVSFTAGFLLSTESTYSARVFIYKLLHSLICFVHLHLKPRTKTFNAQQQSFCFTV